MKLSKKGKTLELNLEIDWGRHVQQKIDREELQEELQKIVEEKVKPLVAKGLSPVAGMRMFPKYKNPTRYPGDLKPSNKPNLELTGEMLSWYRVTPANATDLAYFMGIKDDAPNDVKIRAKANNEGTDQGIPARRFIPRQGESYTREIVLAIRNAFAKVMAEALRKKG